MLPRAPIASFALVLLITAGCAKETIAHKQLEADAIEILTLLAREGVDAEKIRDPESRDLAFNITVAKEEQARAYEVLKSHNLPKTEHKGTVALFESDGMIPTSEQQLAKRQAGVEGDISNRLRRVPRVIDVAVEVSIPEDNPLRDVNEVKPRPKAAVILTYIPDAKGLPPLSVESVQNFVQAGLEELKPNEVSVNMIPAVEAAATTGNGATAGGTAPLSANACEKTSMIGIDVCADHKKRMLNMLVIVLVSGAVLASSVVFSVLRAMKYRRDLTRLTAQVAQIRK
ncbi:MAG: hypothetical protein IT384_21655 [Deltaproteobacteria bacterium]|nr:hypothetical protein [Deltaproteobacteria bacterium]